MTDESFEEFGEWLFANYKDYSFNIDFTFRFLTPHEHHGSLFDSMGNNIADIYTSDYSEIIPYFRRILEMPISEE